MCGSMVDIQSATAEIRRGKEEEDSRNHRAKNIMSASATQGGHNQVRFHIRSMMTSHHFVVFYYSNYHRRSLELRQAQPVKE